MERLGTQPIFIHSWIDVYGTVHTQGGLTLWHILQLIQYLAQPHKEDPWPGSREGERGKKASGRVWEGKESRGGLKREREREWDEGSVSKVSIKIWKSQIFILVLSFFFYSSYFPTSSPDPSVLPLLALLLSNLSIQPLVGDTISYFLWHNNVAIPTSCCKQYLIRSG